MDYKHIVVFITVDSPQTAQKITDALLTERKAACVNIVPAVESHYWWRGKKETAQELLLIVKTRAELLDELVTLILFSPPLRLLPLLSL
jgi:periplasmic divalent cation tolerance protein